MTKKETLYEIERKIEALRKQARELQIQEHRKARKQIAQRKSALTIYAD